MFASPGSRWPDFHSRCVVPRTSSAITPSDSEHPAGSPATKASSSYKIRFRERREASANLQRGFQLVLSKQFLKDCSSGEPASASSGAILKQAVEDCQSRPKTRLTRHHRLRDAPAATSWMRASTRRMQSEARHRTHGLQRRAW